MKPARLWVKIGGPEIKLYSALILLRDGSDEEKKAARTTLEKLLAAKWDEDFHLSAVEPILDERGKRT